MNDPASQPLIQRYSKNPLLTHKNWPYMVHSVFNPGATLLSDGTTLLLCRVEDYRGLSHLTAARSKDGVTDWVIDEQPTLASDIQHFPEELWGLEDPRITYIPELEKYIVAYTAFSRGGPGVSLASTYDFKYFQRFGLVMAPDDKDAALFPRRINGRWALIHRPAGWLGTHIWVSYSNNLYDWGDHKLMLEARMGGWWDANKIGLCCPPIETPRGWLIIYHGVRTTASGSIYRLGLALFDLENLENCLLRGDRWFWGPEEAYERFGDVDNVVFPCGYTIGPDGDTLNFYYGGADSCVALGVGSIQSFLGWLDLFGQPPRM
jgi:predicted GH43/DUF377 family glycosyl hydrolase